MATALKVKPRPANLKLLTDYPNEPPITVKNETDKSDESVLDWIEETRDHYQNTGLRVSHIGILKIADVAGLDPTETKAFKDRIRTVLASEIKAAAATKKKPAAKKPAGKVAAKVAAKPSSNGVAKKPAAKKGGFGGESKLMYSGTVRGVKVEVRKTLEEGKWMISLFGEHPIRKVMQWMGAKGWLTGEAAQACNRLLGGCKFLTAAIGNATKKGPEFYVRATLNEGHIGSGKKAGLTKKGCFGKVAMLTGEQARLLTALRK